MATRWWTSIALFVAVAATQRSARADGAKLSYTRGAGAEACPDEGALREAVAQKVGRDPFDGDDVLVDVHVKRRAGELAADVEVREGDAVLGRRALASTSSSCDELAAAVVVTISIALDPARFGTPPRRSAPPPTPSPADRPFAEEPRPTAPLATQNAERDSVMWRAGAAGGAAFGAAPAPAMALFLSFGARWRRVSLDLEGRTHLRASEPVFGGSVSTTSSLAALVPCLHTGPIALCAVGAAGVVRGEGEGVDKPSTDSSLSAAAGARLAVELPILSEVRLRAGADAMATVYGTRLTLAGREAWASPPLWASAWAGAVVLLR